MTLGETIKQLDALDEFDMLCARRPWSASAECVVTSLNDDLGVPPHIKEAGFEYFLEVFTAREVLEAFGVFSKKPPTEEEKIRLLIHYADYDAYPDWIRKR